MEITVRVRDVEWTEDLQLRVQRTIRFATDRHRDRITRISVCLTDLNGPRGGVDKLCHITADMRGANPVIIKEKGEDVITAINRAARRLTYRIGRRLHRWRIAGAPEHRTTIRAT